MSGGINLCWWNPYTVAISEEQHTSFFTLGPLVRLHPLADTHACPHALQEAETAIYGIAPIVLSHDRLDRLGGLIGVVEWNRANIVVKNMGFNDAVKESSTDEAKFSIDCCSSSAGVGPGCWCVVRQCGIGVLEEGDGH
jgi:hypothetical protein